jgi:hypothetical protein
MGRPRIRPKRAGGSKGSKVVSELLDDADILRPGKGTKRHADGSIRTSDGKYAGSDGTNRSGAQAEADAIKKLEDDGFEVDPKQQYTRTPEDITGTWGRSFTRKDGTQVTKGDEFTVPAGTIRRYDGAVNINGEWKGVETKSGGATRTPEQRAIDTWLRQSGNSLTTSDGRVLTGVHDMKM